MNILNQEILDKASEYINILAREKNITRDEYIARYTKHQLSIINRNISVLLPYMKICIILSIIVAIVLVALIIRNFIIIKNHNKESYYSLDIPFSILLILLLSYTILRLIEYDLELSRDNYIKDPEQEVIEMTSKDLLMDNYFD